MLIERNEVFLFRYGLGVLDNKTALCTDGATDLDDAVDLGDVGGVLRTACLEQLCNTWQTTGDVLRLADFPWGSCDTLACRNLGFLLDLDVRTGRNRVTGENVFGLVDNENLRVQILFVLDDHVSADTSRFVNLLSDRDTRNHVAEFDTTGFLGDDWNVVWVPLNYGLTLLDA